MKGNSGFSLFELCTVIAIIGIVSSIAVPSMIAGRNRAKLGDGARDIYSAFQLAKSRAASNNTNVTVAFAPGGSLGTAFSVFIDDGAGTPDVSPADGIPDGANDGLLNGTELLLSNEQLPPGVSIASTTFTSNAVAFRGNGLPDGVGQAQISNTAGDTHSIFVSIAGRIRIQ